MPIDISLLRLVCAGSTTLAELQGAPRPLPDASYAVLPREPWAANRRTRWHCQVPQSQYGSPGHWGKHLRSGVLHALSLAQTALTAAWGRAALGTPRRRQQAEIDRLRTEVAHPNEELTIKDSRWRRHSPRRRPHYGPTQRMQILRLRAARGWTVAQVAERLLLTEMTIESWMRRLDDQGEDTLVRIEEPVSKYPDFVAYLVRHLKALSPTLGRARIAQMLARAGLHLSANTVRRMLNRELSRDDLEDELPLPELGRRVRAKRPNDIWHVDLTAVPTSGGLWLPYFPYAKVQRWPFCWWVAVCVDHASRRLVGPAVFQTRPTSAEVCAFLGRAIKTVGAKPRCIITDQGKEFRGDFVPWRRRRKIRIRRGGVGRHGSICVAERFIRSSKNECTKRPSEMRRELSLYATWYNEHRPHTWLGGRTPLEIYDSPTPANAAPRFEPRLRWPNGVGKRRGKAGVRLSLDVRYVGNRRHLPVVALKPAA